MGKRRGKSRRFAVPKQSESVKGVEPSAPSQPDPVANPQSLPSVTSGNIGAVDDLARANLRVARWLMTWTAVLALLGAVTAGVGFVQWRALLKTDGTTREAFTAVQRPFIIATDLEAVQTLPLYWTFRTVLENTGSTPTKNMTVTSAVSFSLPVLPDSPPDPKDLRALSTEPYPTVTDHFVGPHAKITVEGVSLLTRTLEEMAEQRADFFVYGVARYNDQFAETTECSTKFCFVVRPYKGPNGLSLANRTLCHHWNCGDEDCERDNRKYGEELREALRRIPKAAEVNRPIPLGAVIPFYPEPLLKAQ
jgi:hypothetical protein